MTEPEFFGDQLSNGIGSLSMFSFFNIGLVSLLVTFIYFLLIGYFILPNKKPEEDEKDDHHFTFEISIDENSKLADKSINETFLKKKYDVKIVKWARGEEIWPKKPEGERVC